MSLLLKYDKKLRQCVPRYVGYAYPFVGSSSSRNGGGDDGSGSGNGNGNGNGGNGNGWIGGNGWMVVVMVLVVEMVVRNNIWLQMLEKCMMVNSVFMQMYLKKVDE